MALSRSLVGALLVVLSACSSDDGDGAPPAFVGGLTPGPAAPAPGAAGSSGQPAPEASPGMNPSPPAPGNTEGTPGEVPLTPETPVDGTAGTATPDAGPVSSEPPAGEGPGSLVPSAGCGSQNPPSGPASITIRGAQADYVVTLPAGYSPDVPTPLIFGFHGRNRTHVEFQTVDADDIQTVLGSRAIMVYMKSQGGPGWNFAAEVPPSVEFFDTLYPQVLATYCVDTSRVYAVGHSSGGYFSIILACRYGDLFRGIGTVAGALQETTCTGERVAGMFVHGASDTVVANSGGRAARDLFITTNACQTATVPGSTAPCVAYQGCAEGFPVQWCEHAEPEYFDNGVATNHGWPSFATPAIDQFFQSLP